LIRRFRANERIQIGELCVIAFAKMHDAGEPHSFMVDSGSVNVGIFTDIGIACDQVIHHFQQCHAAVLEANYDEEMLMNGTYPYYLKKRISDGKGHLSNTQALDLFRKHRPTFMSHLILSHLSKNNNNPELVRELFGKHAGKTEIIVASRDEETALFHIAGKKIPVQKIKKRERSGQQQLSLFDV
jgi:phosphoribosyl 1,2-cyclic phosphodiesterase